MRTKVALFVLMVSFMFSIVTFAAEPKPSLVGTNQSQRRQNIRADEYGLVRVEDRAHSEQLQKSGAIVPLKGEYFVVDPRLRNGNRWVLPYTRIFLEYHGSLFFEQFGEKWQINSALRTREYQKALRKRNANAAPATGPYASSHLTAATVDIAKKPMTKEQLKWMRDLLFKLEREGAVEAVEEHYQLVFHVMVFPCWPECN